MKTPCLSRLTINLYPSQSLKNSRKNKEKPLARLRERGRGEGIRPQDEPGNHAAWRGQCLSRLVRCQSQILHGKIPSPACGGRWPKAGRGDKKPGFIPLGEPSNCAAWRAQHLRRLANPATTPLSEPSNRAAWRTQQPRRLANPAITPLGGPSNHTTWRTQQLRRLARPVFIPLGALPISNFARKNPFPRLRGKVAEGRKGG